MLIAVLALALLSLSSSPIWIRLAEADNEVICLHRMFGAAAVLFLWHALQGKLPCWGPGEKTRPSENQGFWILLSGFLFAIHLWTFVAAAQSTSVAHLVMIFSASPLFTAWGASVFFSDLIPRRMVFAYPLALIGLALLFLDRPANAPVSLAGDLWALLSAILHSGYALAGKRLRIRMNNLSVSFWLNFVAGFFFLIAYVVKGAPSVPYGTPFIPAMIGLVVFPSLLGHTLFTYLLKHMDISILSCAKLAEPGMASLMAYWIFGEGIGSFAGIAFLLIAASVLILFFPFRKLKISSRFPLTRKEGWRRSRLFR